MGNASFIRSSKLLKVFSRHCQTQGAIRSTTYFISIMVVLPVILPKTNWADIISAALAQCAVMAARTTVQTSIARAWLDHISEGLPVRHSLQNHQIIAMHQFLLGQLPAPHRRGIKPRNPAREFHTVPVANPQHVPHGKLPLAPRHTRRQ
jgi:hypothetical protein